MLYDPSCPCANCTLARQEMAEAEVDRVMDALRDAGFVVQEAPNSITGGQGFSPCGTNAYRDMKPGETCRDNYGRVFMRTDYDKTGHDFRELTQHEHEAMESAGKSAWPDKAGFDSQDFSPPKPPIVSGFLAYFPDAVMEVAKVSAAGNRQHGTSGWNKAVSPDELNALGRHLVAHTQGTLRDSDGTLHLAKVAWRAMAALQRLLEA